MITLITYIKASTDVASASIWNQELKKLSQPGHDLRELPHDCGCLEGFPKLFSATNALLAELVDANIEHVKAVIAASAHQIAIWYFGLKENGK